MAKANSTRSTSTTPAPKGVAPASEFIMKAGGYCCGMNAFFDLVEREIREKNNTDFDNIEFLVKGAKAELFKFSAMVVAQEEGAA